MRYLLILIFLSAFFVSFNAGDNITLDKKEAVRAYELINDIRTNPAKYYYQFAFLKSIKIKTTPLHWNDTLAQVAETKAYDMADKNYFAHVDPQGYGINYLIAQSGYQLNPLWTKHKNENNFESIAAGTEDAESTIAILLIDKGQPSLGHRKHLLGLEQWNASLVDIGIGFARRNVGGDFKTYVSIVIAKHDW